MYQRVQFNIGRPVDPVLGTGYFREDVELQIFVNAPVNQGTGEALDRAELLRKHFAKGLALPEQGDMLHVLTTPQIAGCAVIGNRVIVPVIIAVTVEVLC
jgi:hypothetical protein